MKRARTRPLRQPRRSAPRGRSKSGPEQIESSDDRDEQVDLELDWQLAAELVNCLRTVDRALYGPLLRLWYLQLESAKHLVNESIEERYDRYRDGLPDAKARELAARHEYETLVEVRLRVEKDSLPLSQLAVAIAHEHVAHRAHQRALEHLKSPALRHTRYDHELWSAWQALQVLGLKARDVRKVLAQMVDAIGVNRPGFPGG